MAKTAKDSPAHIQVSRENLVKTANLARLHLNDSEIEKFQSQIAKACESFEKINEIDVDGIKPLMSPVEEESSLRADVVQNDGVTDLVLDQAPELQGRLFRVPPVV
jgi:aspartyl-tRNA(Asn)/glutamyl-tRNA(Gln) amidotransferase subunit C